VPHPDDNQKRAYRFLKKKFDHLQSFTKKEFRRATGWAEGSFETYFRKQFETLLNAVDDAPGRFFVGEAFKKFPTWEQFKSHVSQNRSAYADYVSQSYPHVVMFDFFMPLANEGYLRMALDSLFYKDAIERKLRLIGTRRISAYFPRKKGETRQEHIDRVCGWISSRFLGYSILHVGGRYRAEALRRAAEIFATSNPTNIRYIIDETTAVVRFVFPVGEPIENRYLPNEAYIERILGIKDDDGSSDEANKVRWVFYNLFVQSVVQLINGEDEIWLLESGFANRLHKWVKRGER